MRSLSRLFPLAALIALGSSVGAQAPAEEDPEAADEAAGTEEEAAAEEVAEDEEATEEGEGFYGDPYEDDQDQGPEQPRTICHGRMIREVRVEGARRVEADDVRASMRLRRGLPCTDDELARTS